MRLIDADALKARKVYSRDLAENVVPTACIDWAETIDAASPWHRVEERLPDDSREVIIFTASRIEGVGSFIRPNWYQWYSGGGLPVDVTYWMPMPEPPEGDA